MGRKTRRNYDIFSQHTYFVPDVADLLILLVWFFVGALLGNVVSVIFTFALGAEAAMEYATIISYPLMFIPPMLYASFKSRSRSYSCEGRRLDSSHFGKNGALLTALMLSVCTLACGLPVDYVNSLLPPMPEWLEKVLKGMTQGKIWINLICVSVFAPLFEEWLCRGMVLRGLLNCKRKEGRGIRPVWAIIISAAFFALIHLNPWQAIPAFALGLLFGYVYYKTGSLKLTMLMHCVNNTFAVICGQIPALKDVDNWTQIMNPYMYGILCACSFIILALTVLNIRKIETQDGQGNCDAVSDLFSSEQ